MKRPLFPRPRPVTPFAEKFGRDVTHFGRGAKPEPPPKTYLPLIILGMAGALVLCIGIFLLGRIPKVGSVSAEDGRIYSAEVLLHFADVESGDELWGFDTFTVEKRMKKEMPLLSSVQVKKHLSGDVSITVSEYESLYYTCHNRNYYIFTTDEREVLCALPDDSEARRVGAVYIGFPESTRVRVGEKISYIHLPYVPDGANDDHDYEIETKTPDEENAYADTFIKTLMASSLAPRVRGMELSDRYDLWFVLEGNIRVKIGDISELEDKLNTLTRALAEREAEEGYAGELPLSVDVSDPTRIIFRASPEVEIPVWGK